MAARRIKILHLITSLDTGGAEMMLTHLAPAMDRHRFENVVVSLTTAGPLAAKVVSAARRRLQEIEQTHRAAGSLATRPAYRPIPMIIHVSALGQHRASAECAERLNSGWLSNAPSFSEHVYMRMLWALGC